MREAEVVADLILEKLPEMKKGDIWKIKTPVWEMEIKVL